MNLQEFSFDTGRLKLAGYRNEVSEGVPVIAVHGWLDNAASFEPLASYMQADAPFYAVELPGHGHSAHRPVAATYHMLDNVVDIAAFIEALAKGRAVNLIGHSLGGIICAFVAAAVPQLVNKLVLLDSLGPMTDKSSNVLPQFRKAIAKALRQGASSLTVYETLEDAARLRMKGIGAVNYDSAKLLVARGLKQVQGGYSWRSDSRLMDPSLLRLSEGQLKAIFEGIECPVCLICGEQGYFKSYEALKYRLSYIARLEKHHVAGGHHFHMEGDLEATTELITNFFA